MRVVPGPQAEAAQAARGVAAADAEQRAPVAAAARRHPGQRPGARAAGQPEQHGLGLVVQGVAEQHGRGAGDAAASSSAWYLAAAGRRLRARPAPPAAGTRRACHRVEAQAGQGRRPRGRLLR